VPAGSNLSFLEADLMSDVGWTQAAAGCKYALHVASPTAAGDLTGDEMVTPQETCAVATLS